MTRYQRFTKDLDVQTMVAGWTLFAALVGMSVLADTWQLLA